MNAALRCSTTKLLSLKQLGKFFIENACASEKVHALKRKFANEFSRFQKTLRKKNEFTGKVCIDQLT